MKGRSYRRRRSIVDCAAPPSHLSKKLKSESLGINNVPAKQLDSRFTFVRTENYSLVVRWVLLSKSAKSTAQVVVVVVVAFIYSRLLNRHKKVYFKSTYWGGGGGGMWRKRREDEV